MSSIAMELLSSLWSPPYKWRPASQAVLKAAIGINCRQPLDEEESVSQRIYFRTGAKEQLL